MCENYSFLKPRVQDPNVTYPLEVLYCEECGFPPEYCIFGKTPNECKIWYDAYMKNKAKEDQITEQTTEVIEETSNLPQIEISLISNDGNVQTKISGLKEYDIDLRAARKFMSNKLSVSANFSGFDLILQGDVTEKAKGTISSKWTKVYTCC